MPVEETHLFLGASGPHGLPYPITLGGTIAVLGGSGSGKTTLCRLIASRARAQGQDPDIPGVDIVAVTRPGGTGDYPMAHEVTDDPLGALWVLPALLHARKDGSWQVPLLYIVDGAEGPRPDGTVVRPHDIASIVEEVTVLGAQAGITVVWAGPELPLHALPRIAFGRNGMATTSLTWFGRHAIERRPRGEWLVARPAQRAARGLEPSCEVLSVPGRRR